MALKFKAGDPFPTAELLDETGNAVSIAELAGGNPLILTFYRGYW
ncbi:MAG: redoxin domain-containing protein [SAR324 cluster bacterium]|nr:redoxin domain-containing protein [SAR324 cluster bacterium]MCZ6627303.1 redoxin domain-containing protein [SAR324 cluster bacterium]MCZ6842286.1 redoxin domain-containing protein [SAR324 cluster bacterium]